MEMTLGSKELWQRVERWDLGFVASKLPSRDSKTIEMNKCITEYRKFMFVCAKYPNTNFGMAGTVDMVWHEHILHTKDYMDFCNNICGTYVHHEPSTSNFKPDSYKRTLDYLKMEFGSPDTSIWPIWEDAQCSGCSSCERISAQCEGGYCEEKTTRE
jgi:hypothetical protein